MTNRKDMTSDQTTFFPSEKSYTSGNNTSDDGGSSRPSAHASGMAAPSIIENRRNIASSQASLQSDSQSAESLATSFSLFSNRTVRNFVWMSVLFSANHASVVSCLALATARLGSTGAWQSGILYLTYTGSALTGGTWVVKTLGARNGMAAGMALYCSYVYSFWLATSTAGHDHAKLIAWTGAAIGGIGGGLIWTAQGAYFARAAEELARDYPNQTRTTREDATSQLASIFAFIYLAEELVSKSLSTLLLEIGGLFTWSFVFASYAVVAVLSTLLMWTVHKYEDNENNGHDGSATALSARPKIATALSMLWSDPKMKYMIGLNALFGFASSFLNSFVNGVVVEMVLHDPKYIGALTAWLSAIAAVMSLVFGRVSLRWGKGPVLNFGAICFFMVAFPFVAFPDLERWTWPFLVGIYTLHGTGRATFEGTLKATFADYFGYEKEGAFANIILQNGLSSAIGYVLTLSLLCKEKSAYCIPYQDGKFHDVLTFEILILVFAIIAILGHWRASVLHRQDQQTAATISNTIIDTEQDVTVNLLENREEVSPSIDFDGRLTTMSARKDS